MKMMSAGVTNFRKCLEATLGYLQIVVGFQMKTLKFIVSYARELFISSYLYFFNI